MMTISYQQILRQAYQDIAMLECMRPASDLRPDPPFIMFFRGVDDNGEIHPEPGRVGVRGWYYMRLWVATDDSAGILRDTKCPYQIDRDITTAEFTDCMREVYTMRKIGGDEFVSPAYYTGGRIWQSMNLVYDRNYNELGYYPLGSRMMRSCEDRP